MNSELPEDGRSSIWRDGVKAGGGAPGRDTEHARGRHGTQGEIEAAICERMSRFVQEYMGRGPKDRQRAVVSELHDQGFTRDDAIEAICQAFRVPRGAAWWFVVWHPAWVAEAPAGGTGVVDTLHAQPAPTAEFGLQERK